MLSDRQEKLKKYHKSNSSELWLYIEHDKKTIQGIVWTPCISVPIHFGNLAELLLTMNQVFDAIDFPQRFFAKRSMSGTKKVKIPGWIYAHLRVPAAFPPKRSGNTHLCPRMTAFPFFIRVRQRQNASWQGELYCLKSGRHICFRSEQELMELITEAVDDLRKNGPLLAVIQEVKP